MIITCLIITRWKYILDGFWGWKLMSKMFEHGTVIM